MTDQGEPEPEPGPQRMRDRRAPTARYVAFHDPAVEARFVATAERDFRLLLGSDSVANIIRIDLPGDEPPPPPPKRGLFRRQPAPSPPPPPRRVPATAALARVARGALEIPDALEASAKGCPASTRVARLLAQVADDLVNDLLGLEPAEQARHPAYRQTLRVGAELQALRDIIDEIGCPDPDGCVDIRPPEHWGGREEDVEVEVVLDVLNRLATADDDSTP